MACPKGNIDCCSEMFSISPYQTVMETQLHLAIKPVQMKYPGLLLSKAQHIVAMGKLNKNLLIKN
jgi:hypothetical protein